MEQVTPVTNTLQAATYDQIMRIGMLPFFEAVAARQLAADSYVALLRGLTTIYAAFDRGMVAAQAAYPVLSAIWDQHVHKQPLLAQDLALFAATPARDIPAATLGAEVLAERIRVRATRDPLSLLGGAYVLATWNMGGAALCEQVARSLGLSGMAGTAYLASFDAWGQAHWPRFAAHLNAVPLDSEGHQRVVAAARETLDGIEQLIFQLHPPNDNPTSELVRILNPLAGNHQIAADLREVQAAMRAGERTWLLIPYYELRYGQKGRQYTWSDAGWMVTLAGHSQPIVDQQVQWLSRYLSTRGMPQWTMECHLQLLYEDLSQAVPERRDSYAPLAQAGRALAEQRRAYISDAALVALDQAFYARVGREWRAWLPHSGTLLASAVADEKMGIPRAVESIEAWMTDAARFPAVWIDAVHATIGQARQQSH